MVCLVQYPIHTVVKELLQRADKKGIEGEALILPASTGILSFIILDGLVAIDGPLRHESL